MAYMDASSRKTKKIHTPEQIVKILKKHLVYGVPVSTLCAEFELSAPVFYEWERRFFDEGTKIFEEDSKKRMN